MARPAPLISDHTLRAAVLTALRRGLESMVPQIFVQHGHSRAAGTRAMTRWTALLATVRAVAVSDFEPAAVLDAFARDAMRRIANNGHGLPQSAAHDDEPERLGDWLGAMADSFAAFDPKVRVEREKIARAQPVPVQPAEVEPQSKGVSQAQIDLIKRRILGISTSNI